MKNKYIHIYRDIVEKIRNKTIKPQSTLPSEHELMEVYETSRETIRKALNVLAQNGFIQKVQGKGSIVLDSDKIDFPVSGLVTFKELAKNMGQTYRTIVQFLDVTHPSDELMSKLDLEPSDEVWRVFRIREIDDEKVILDKDFIKRDYVETLTREVCENSIYEYIENELGMLISFAKKEIIVEEPSEEDREHLDLEGFSNIVVVKNFVYLEDASLFQYTESRHRPDKFRFVDFARRMK
ncbi:trehalose operon repressor [Texcoconibacillus texcoconensis]|uniref:Trehalose operon repressor n=1 Tax=Texcoconibacillus texcoconensis TaxID=1095777 RepID=A0A840QTM7_9BACI|nr:trehalose operon repressor [Texcoconibacillus texcoconensis]MBB5174641.1 GntR family trehalose operon transcriptional repressor [Texcoconibacillus texcoconensis]